jgi:hypothetical protein
MTPEQQRRTFQKLKTLTSERFWKAMNLLHSKAYAAAMRHYDEAMSIVLTPKKRAEVNAKAAEIRADWDGMEQVSVGNVEFKELLGVDIER